MQPLFFGKYYPVGYKDSKYIRRTMNRAESLYSTDYGQAFTGNSLELLNILEKNSVNLVLTSPPFSLLRAKEYGNVSQDNYVDWLADFAWKIKTILTDDGSFVLDLGGAYEKGKPVRSLYNYKILIKFCEEIGFKLAEEFFWFNPSKLPSPIEWVNKRKIRAKDSVNTIWWFSKSDFPKANVKNVLVPYSDRMKKLLNSGKKYYKPKLRPSGHDISTKFNNDNGGAIPSNLLQIPNSESNSKYLKSCKIVGVKSHPARFPKSLPDFFIKFLTDPGDLVLDIFAGSNTTGEAAEDNGRRWIAFDESKQYLAASAFRFIESYDEDELKAIYNQILGNQTLSIKIPRSERQLNLWG